MIALGLGSLACGRSPPRRQRSRLGTRFTGGPLQPPALSEGAQDAATLLHRFADAPALQSFEAANCLLALSLDGQASPPAVRAVCVSEAGVTFFFAEDPREQPPEPFVSRAEDGAWHVSHKRARWPGHDLPPSPRGASRRRDAAGTWFVPVESGGILPLLGEAAPALWPAARAAVSSWAWSETILVTEDPDDPRFHAEVAADPLVRGTSSSVGIRFRSRPGQPSAAR